MGTFDGVHRGHQALLARSRERAAVLGGEVVAVAFDRPPRFFFHAPTSPSLLTTPDEKERLLRQFGADRVETLRFGAALARMPADDFLTKYIRGRWNAREMVVGFNFFFGRDRSGNAAFLEREGPRHGLRVHRVPALTDGRGAVSSGIIRECVARGDARAAHRLLGHPYLLIARVKRGRGLGRRLGFPTANLDVPSEKILPPGAHAVNVWVPTGVRRGGLMNIGTRPTVGGRRRSAEVHVLDYSGELPGRTLIVEWVGPLRAEKKFSSQSALRAQLVRDEARARSQFFS